MTYRLLRVAALQVVASCYLVNGSAAGQPRQASPSQTSEPAAFNPLTELAAAFPDTIGIKNKGHLLEFCPDGTCDGFVVTGSMPVNTLRDFAYLFEYFFSDYTYLDEWRARPGPRNAVGRVLSKPEYRDCKRNTARETARCILVDLSRDDHVKLIFVRYDEGERHSVPMDLAKQLSDKKPITK